MTHERDLNAKQKKMLRALRGEEKKSRKTGRSYNPSDPKTIEWELDDLAKRGVKEGALVTNEHAQWEEPHPAKVVFVGVGRRKSPHRRDEQDRVLVQLQYARANDHLHVVTLVYTSTLKLQPLETDD